MPKQKKPRKTPLDKAVALLPPGRYEEIQAATPAGLQTILARQASDRHELEQNMAADDELREAREALKNIVAPYREALAVCKATVAVVEAEKSARGLS